MMSATREELTRSWLWKNNMKKTAGMLLSLAVLYVYGYRLKQRQAACPFYKVWHGDEEIIQIRLSGVVSIQTGQKKVFGYISICDEVEQDIWEIHVRLRRHGGILCFRYAEQSLQQLSADGSVLHTYR